jgi:hypothetical protein
MKALRAAWKNIEAVRNKEEDGDEKPIELDPAILKAKFPPTASEAARDRPGRPMGLKIGGRGGAEHAARDKVPQQALDDLLEQSWESGEWVGLVDDGTHELAILHRPDQVAGGYDVWSDLPKAPSRDDTKEWQKYLEKLKKYFGPSVVNTAIGDQWRSRIYDSALPDVRKAVPVKASYPLHRLNLRLKEPA